MKINFLAFIMLIAFWATASSQSIQQRKNDSVFVLVKKYFNAKQADSIYSLVGEKSRQAMSRETFQHVAETQLFPIGQIKESALISFVNNKTSTYKLVFESVTLQLLIELDEKEKLELFLFQPYKQEADDKLAPAPATNPMHTLTDKRVDSAARKYIQKANTVGLSIGILKNGVVTTYNYGETAQGSKKLPGANSLFEIGSITKTFTATLLAYYVSEGKVKLTDPITKYLPDSVASNKELQAVTLEMLSNHTSGLPGLPDNFENHSSYPMDPYKTYSRQHLFSYLKTCKLHSKPGEAYAYSNLAVGLLGTILEKVSENTFEQMVEQIICTPLGLKSTVQHINPSQSQRFLKVYNEAGKETPAWNFDALAPCGSLKSTVNDLLIYARANMTPADNKLSKALQLTHQVTFTQKDLKLGLAWHIIIINNVEYYFHNGGTYGSSSFLVFNPQRKLAVIVLSNSGARVDAVGTEIVKKIQ